MLLHPRVLVVEVLEDEADAMGKQHSGAARRVPSRTSMQRTSQASPSLTPRLRRFVGVVLCPEGEAVEEEEQTSLTEAEEPREVVDTASTLTEVVPVAVLGEAGEIGRR